MNDTKSGSHTAGGEILKKRILSLAAAAVLTLSSCSAQVEELLSPPRLDGEQTEIYSALRKFTSGDIIFKYPRSGQYRSAFVVTNLDSEPTDEAIVFYEVPNVSDGSSLRMNFLDKQDGKWVSVYDFAASGSEVDSVRFEDLGSGSTMIIVTYLMQSTSDRYTSVMTYSDGFPEELMSVRNIFMDVFDTDGDGSGEMFVITNERPTGSAWSRIYGTKDGKFGELGFTPLNSGFAGIKDVSCGITEGLHAVFVDYTFSDGTFGTDAVISGNGYYYLSPALDPDVTLRESNSYTPYIPCMDVDGDGETEIPRTVPFPTFEEMPASERINMTEWYKLTRNATAEVLKYRSFVGTKGDYIFLFPDNWLGVTAAVSISEGAVVFNRYDNISGTMGEELLRLYGTADSGTDKFEDGGYRYLGRSESTGYSYYAVISESRSAPSDDELEKLFILR
ncbi:MAG: hypothetical protein II820_01590 [Ruminiclostridium sp.]|nr:hypothetical protein [Ruminiclostridium sp.]